MTAGSRTSQIFIIYAIFFLQAFAGGGIFARIPDIQTGIGLSDGALGVALTFLSVGGLISLLVSGRLVQLFGTRPTMILCLPALAVTHLAAAQSGGMLTLCLSFVVAGIAFSISNVAINVEADRVEAAIGQPIMNGCHGMWSLGMLAAALIGVAARAIPVPVAWHFAGILALVLPVSFALWRMFHAAPPRGTGKLRKTIAMPDRVTMVLLLFGLSATVAQVGVQNWSVIYMADRFDAPAWIDTLTLPAFLFTMALGRLYADQWIVRIGARPFAQGMAVLSLMGGLFTVFAPSLWFVLAGFALTGFGTAALFPMMISAAARVTHRPSEDSVASVILLLGVVILGVPAAMGWIAELTSLRVAFAATLPLFLVTFALSKRMQLAD